MALMIDKLDPNARIIINGLEGGTVVAYLSQDIGISGAADYQTPEGSAAQQKFSDTVTSLKRTANRFGGNTAQTQLKNIAGTVMNWQGSQNFQMTLPLLFVATRANDDVRAVCKVLLGALYPEIQGSKDFFSQLVAPNNYAPGKGSYAQGTVSLKIGNWFKTPSLFLLTGCDFQFSKETMADTHRPLWASGSASFMSFRLLGRDEVTGFFV